MTSVISDAHVSGYNEVKLYGCGKDQPSIYILRHVSQYLDGGVGIQDEIDLRNTSRISEEDRGKRLQLNFEIKDQKFFKFPQTEPSNYIKAILGAFQDFTHEAGSKIWVNNSRCWVSDGQAWRELDRTQAQRQDDALSDNQTPLLR